MPLYDANDNLRADPCAREARQLENDSVLAYHLYDKYGVCNRRSTSTSASSSSLCKERQQKLQQFALESPNLRYWDGYGSVNACSIDRVAYSKADNTKAVGERQSLPHRVFVAAPDISRASSSGRSAPDVESDLRSSRDTSVYKRCGRLSEVTLHRLVPNVDVQCAEHAVPEFPWGGESSRDIARTPEFLRSLGYDEVVLGEPDESRGCAYRVR